MPKARFTLSDVAAMTREVRERCGAWRANHWAVTKLHGAFTDAVSLCAAWSVHVLNISANFGEFGGYPDRAVGYRTGEPGLRRRRPELRREAAAGRRSGEKTFTNRKRHQVPRHALRRARRAGRDAVAFVHQAAEGAQGQGPRGRPRAGRRPRRRVPVRRGARRAARRARAVLSPRGRFSDESRRRRGRQRGSSGGTSRGDAAGAARIGPRGRRAGEVTDG